MLYRFLTGLILMLGATAGLWAQSSVEAELARKEILIGDQVNFQIRVSHPAGTNVEIDLSPLANVEKLEIVREAPLVSKEDAGITYLEKNVAITSFDSGTYFVPQIPVRIIGENGEVEELTTNRLPLTVAGIPITNDSIQLAPIKDIVREPLNVWDVLPYLLSFIGIAVLATLIWWFFFQKKEPEINIDPPILLAAHRIAMDKLDQLAKKKLWQKGQVKEYYSQLTFIAREYLEHRYKIPALENTTGEILRNLQREPLVDGDLQQQLRHILTASDMVKFAKAEPADAFHIEAFETTRSFVDKTKDITIAPIPVLLEEDEIISTITNPIAAASVEAARMPVTSTVAAPAASGDQVVAAGEQTEVQLANFWPRFFARVIDVLLTGLISGMILLLGIYLFRNENGAVSYTALVDIGLFILACYWVYFALIPFRLGAEAGKLMVRIRMVDLDNQPVSLSKATVRFLGKIISELLLGLGYLTYFFNKQRQTLPDLIAKTKVIKGLHLSNFVSEEEGERLLIQRKQQLAGFWPRFFARLIDLNLSVLIAVIIAFLVGWGFGIDVPEGEEPFWLEPTVYLVFALFLWAYYAWMTSHFGGTLGKLALRIQVVNMEGKFISKKRATLRLLGKFISETVYGLGYFTYFLDKKNRQSLPDIFANTRVIKKPEKKNVVLLDDMDN
ncbi:MAG: RDD family protein [Saprospiraceae bacterium]